MQIQHHSTTWKQKCVHAYHWQINLHYHSLQCFDAVGWEAGRHPACKKLSGGVLEWCRLAYGPADATATHCLLPQ